MYGIYDSIKTAEKINRSKENFIKKSALFWIPVVVLVLGTACLLGYFFSAWEKVFRQKKVVTATAIRQGDNIIIVYQGGVGHSLVSKLKYGLEIADHDWNSPRVGKELPFMEIRREQITSSYR